jgi:hypothetical protein
MIRALGAVIAIWFLAGCQTGPLRYADQKEGQWQAKALVRDKSAGKSVIVNLDVNAIQREKLRMDVTAALGHPVASLLLDGDSLTYVLLESKQYFRGPSGSQAFRPVLSIPLDPRLLHNVFFDLPIEDKSWSCTMDKKGYLAECREAASNLVIKWSDRQGRKKLISVEHPQGLVQINVNSFQPKVEAKFELNPPKSFRAIR